MSSPDTLWYTRCPVPTALGIASQLGWLNQEFAADGIQLASVHEREFLSRYHSRDYCSLRGFRQGGCVPAIWEKAEGHATRVIGISWTDEYQAVIALPESGISNARELRGRRIGLPLHASHRVDFHRAMALRGVLLAAELGGLAYGELDLVDVVADEPAALLQAAQLQAAGRGVSSLLNGAAAQGQGVYASSLRALLRGDIDALYVQGAHGLQLANLLGAREVVDLGNHPDPFVRTNNGTLRPLTVDQALLDEHPELVARFLARVVSAGQWAEENPAEALAYIARESNAPERWVRSAYGNDVHRHLQTSLSEKTVEALYGFTDFLSRWGFIKKDFDAYAWIAPEPLEALRREGRLSVA